MTEIIQPPQAAPRRKLFIRTYGCQMNVYDSQRMADLLRPLGYGLTEAQDDADMVVLNTCHIREKASEKVFSELGRLRLLREAKRAEGIDLVVAVAGCVAQAEGEEILRRAPMVDIVVGPQAYHRLPEMVARAERAAGARRGGRGAGVLDTEFPAEPKFDFLPAPTTVTAGSAFLSIQEGCDKFCTFCVVPYTRGAEYSRPAVAILAEARTLIAAGALELTLLGQNVNAWHGEALDGSTWNLARLIRALAEIDGVRRLRYTTSHPRDMDDDLIAAHGEVPALMPYLHLPVQSGSDRVLEAMNRQHGRDRYLGIVDRLRAVRSDIALSSDFIVGFPGESDADFDDTMRLIEEVGFASAFSFKYSMRPGTPGAAMPDQVPEAVKEARLAALQSLLRAQHTAFNERMAGRTVEVLFQERGRREGQLIGKSPWQQSVYAPAPERLIGQLIDVRIAAGHANSLAGDVVSGLEVSGVSDDIAQRGNDVRRLTFDDNALLQILVGQHDRNLVRIEQLLGVRIDSRGNQIALSGPADSIAQANAVITALYERLRRGQAVEPGDVDAAVRFARVGGDTPSADTVTIRTRRRVIQPRTPTQRDYVEAIRDRDLVFGLGPAGTGKTYLAVAMAVSMLTSGSVERIILSRPAVEAGERLGFLPGDLKDKVDPYLRPLYDALHDMLPADQIDKRLESGEIEVAPLAFMRGRTLAHAFVILDEAQNTTAMQMKMFLTRMGEGSRMVITGDLSQIDLPSGVPSGLRDAIDTVNGVEGVRFVNFSDRDVVRHDLVARIVRAYDARDRRRAAGSPTT